MDLAMFFGAKRKKKSTVPLLTDKKKHSKKKSPKGVLTDKLVGVVVVRRKERKLFRGKKGGLYYKTKKGRRYIDPAEARKAMRHHKGSPKHKAKPKAKKVHHKKHYGMMHYGYGLGQPPLIDMMGPAGLSVVPPAPVSAPKASSFGYRYY